MIQNGSIGSEWVKPHKIIIMVVVVVVVVVVIHEAESCLKIRLDLFLDIRLLPEKCDNRQDSFGERRRRFDRGQPKQRPLLDYQAGGLTSRM